MTRSKNTFFLFMFVIFSCQCLDVSGNDYGAKGCGVILQGLAKNAMLQEVHLGGMEIGDKSIDLLLKFIRYDGKNLTHFDLRATPLGKKGLNVVLEDLAECPKLKVG
jgi:hypothetical protein